MLLLLRELLNAGVSLRNVAMGGGKLLFRVGSNGSELGQLSLQHGSHCCLLRRNLLRQPETSSQAVAGSIDLFRASQEGGEPLSSSCCGSTLLLSGFLGLQERKPQLLSQCAHAL